MKKIILSILTVSIISSGLYAQQLHTSSLYELQTLFHNPAMAGNQTSDLIGISYRKQWAGISGAPRTATAFGSADIQKSLIGLSGYMYSDQTGPTSRNGVQLAFAKHLPVDDKGGRISLGLETRFFQFALDRDKLSSIINDPAIANTTNKTKFDVGFGFAYNNRNFQFGVSVAQLVQSKLDFYSGNLTTNAEARLYRHYYAHSLYRINAGGGTVIVPNFLMVYLPQVKRSEVQIGARLERDLFWVGAGYRANQSYMLNAGININDKFSVGYSFDDYTSPLSTFDGGAGGHELILKYRFNKKKLYTAEP